MIIRQAGDFEISSLYPNTNWYEGELNFIIDETTEEGQLMAEIYQNNYPLVEFGTDGEFVISMVVIELEKPPEINGKIIELIKNDLGDWEYIYVDIPLTKEQELENEIASLRAMIETLVGGGE